MTGWILAVATLCFFTPKDPCLVMVWKKRMATWWLTSVMQNQLLLQCWYRLHATVTGFAMAKVALESRTTWNVHISTVYRHVRICKLKMTVKRKLTKLITLMMVQMMSSIKYCTYGTKWYKITRQGYMFFLVNLFKSTEKVGHYNGSL